MVGFNLVQYLHRPIIRILVDDGVMVGAQQNQIRVSVAILGGKPTLPSRTLGFIFANNVAVLSL